MWPAINDSGTSWTRWGSPSLGDGGFAGEFVMGSGHLIELNTSRSTRVVIAGVFVWASVAAVGLSMLKKQMTIRMSPSFSEATKKFLQELHGRQDNPRPLRRQVGIL